MVGRKPGKKPVERVRKKGSPIQPPKGEGTQGSREGRPFVDFDMEVAKEAARIMCTREEAAALCKVSVDTLERRMADIGKTWTEFFAEHSADGRASLRRSMFKTATSDEDAKQKGTMQIWLSKQHLGMKDKTEHGFDPTQPAKFVIKMGKEIPQGETE